MRSSLLSRISAEASSSNKVGAYLRDQEIACDDAAQMFRGRGVRCDNTASSVVLPLSAWREVTTSRGVTEKAPSAWVCMTQRAAMKAESLSIATCARMAAGNEVSNSAVVTGSGQGS